MSVAHGGGQGQGGGSLNLGKNIAKPGRANPASKAKVVPWHRAVARVRVVVLNLGKNIAKPGQGQSGQQGQGGSVAHGGGGGKPGGSGGQQGGGGKKKQTPAPALKTNQHYERH